MSPSKLILLLTVALIFLAWMKALAFSVSREFPEDPARQKKALQKAATLFGGLIMLELAAGYSGIFSRFDRFPPPFTLFFVGNVILLPVLIAFSQFGSLLARHISERALTGFQSFRILAELLIFSAVHEGIAPAQMSFEGYNPDLLTGLSAVGLYFYLRGKSSSHLTVAFQIWGLLALIIIGFIAITSMPTPLRLFMNEPSNVWVTAAPYTLLPGVLVSGALTGHLIFFRKRFLSHSK